MVPRETPFEEKVLDSFSKIQKEIKKGSLEMDIRYKFVRYFVEGVLGYEPRDFEWEKKKADITIFDNDRFEVIKIETKRPSEDINKEVHKEQALKYIEGSTRYVGLTNFLHFKLWEIKEKPELKVDLEFDKILNFKRFEKLVSKEKSQILFLSNLTKEIIFDSKKYQKFNEYYAKIDITKDSGFKKLLERLNFIANDLLLGYTLKSFGEYKEGYNKYLTEVGKTENEMNNHKKNKKLNHSIAKYRQKLEEKYEKYIPFSGFYLWKQYSGKDDIPDEEVREIFCKETIYVLLNKLLFIRICEDKNLLEKNISNGGVEELRKFLIKRFSEDSISKEILEMAFKTARGLYSHFYEIGILDWYRTGDGELNEILNRVLWILNQFNFTHIDRDILGNLYEKYLPSKERKKLGEFYTPVEVVDYILTSVGYTYSHDIETKDLLDPACGSGTFLVRATRRLISRYVMKFGKTNKKELRSPKNWKEIVGRLSPDEAKIILDSIQEHIHGLDINPFACSIAEMNILFQIIDLYQKVREKYSSYKLERFKIYRTDSLEKPTQKDIWDYSQRAFLEEQEEIDKIKQKKFDFVVGNPPWGGILKREKGSMLAKRLKQDYVSAVGKYDIYVLFIERGVTWLKTNGRFGYIVQNRFLRAKYGEKIRKYLLENVKIEKIVDFGDTRVFADATNYPAIIIFEKEKVKDNQIIYIEIKEKANELSTEEVINYVKSYSPDSRGYLSIIRINQKELKELDSWLPSQIMINLIKKRVKNLKYLNDVTKEIMQGITFGGKGADDIYVIDNEIKKSLKLESDLCKKVLKGRDIRKYELEWDNRFLFYPYDSKGNEINLEDYPNAFEYIKQFESKLSSRILDGKKFEKWGKKWFSFWRLRNPEVFNKQKILVPRISMNNNFALDNEGEFYLTDSTIAIIPREIDIKYLLGVLNSNFLFYIIKNTSPFVQGRYYSYTRTYLENLPIKLPETPEEKKIAKQITNKVNKILELHKQGIIDIDEILKGEKTEKLCNLPRVIFRIKDKAKFEKVKTEENKIYINSSDFIEIKDEKILDFVEIYFGIKKEEVTKIKDLKKIIINLPIPKSEEILKNIIHQGKIDKTKIKEKVKKLEEEINELVYKIYGINEKEKKIIESSLE